QDRSTFSLKNRMVVYTIANVILLATIYLFLGGYVLCTFVAAAVLGIGLLETINYIEHYGLVRKQNAKGRYEPVRHHHSWNSDHVLGRAVLFNLSRHSDHHYNGSTKYQVLRSMKTSPQMPTGYPGMVILALFQPLWFWVMNKKLAEVQGTANTKKVAAAL
ncbi:MAG: fatty acid desaturase, partial [Bacteroidota bacterium]